MNNLPDRLRRYVHGLTPQESKPFQPVLARLGQRRRRRALAASGAALVSVTAILIAAQGLGPDEPTNAAGLGPSTSSPTQTATEQPEPTYEWSRQPAPVIVQTADGSDIELTPSSYCWSGPPDARGISPGRCVDGYPRMRDLERVGSRSAVDFWFGVVGWDFQATFTELGEDCPRQHTVSATPTGDDTFRLDPAGPAGRYRVDLFGRGPHGSVSTSFIWRTPNDGPLDEPSADMALVTGDDGHLRAYQLEIGVRDLASQPREVEISVEVAAANGRSMNLDAQLEDLGQCYAEGSLFFRGEDDSARQVAQLGPAPFTYEVLLTLDGKLYVGSAVWPRDEKKNQAPNTVLSFDPPLPAYAGD